MDQPAPHSATRAELLEELGDILQMPVLALVAGWHGDHLVNLGEEGARAFVEVLDRELEQCPEEPDSLALFAVGRGGFPGFADAVVRALGGRKLEITTIIPYRVDGVFTLLSLAADQRIIHPYGALGAYDRRPIGKTMAALDSEVARVMDEPAANADQRAVALAYERRQAQLAHRLMERLTGGTESGLGARIERELSAETLGCDLALGHADLERIGLSARLAGEQQASTIWRLYRAFEEELEYLEPPTPRYTQSDVADEVEFEPAMGLTGALIETAHQSLRYELDTGSPDPDTNMLTGEWLWHELDRD